MMPRLLQRDGDDPIQFLAFLVWYIFLVLCCLIPTCCAYRRRRMMEHRLAEQQATMQHRLQQSNLLFLSNLSQHDTGGGVGQPLERVRTQLIKDDLASTTLTLEAHHFVDSAAAAIPAKTMDGAAAGEEVKEDIESQQPQNEQDVSESEEHTGWIRLPVKSTTMNPDDAVEDDTNTDVDKQGSSRLVPDTCTICLCRYDEGESITWSARSECTHAFHTDCIISWLAKQDHGPQCPVCRQEFCSRTFMPVGRQEDEFLRTISQALLLTQLYGARRLSWENGGVQLVANVRPEAEGNRRTEEDSDV